ncbi:MAG TPA: rhodanese-like domain-containing protein [Candidatus Tectomicrobia bacterium]|nr:rhodanese-like domain-containing protein [Candidatus Tectomicrobia bacterium]
MAIVIGRHEVQRLMDQGAQLVDVLPRGDYDEEHIAGAISVPLGRLAEDAERLRGRPVIVYCHDHQ